MAAASRVNTSTCSFGFVPGFPGCAGAASPAGCIADGTYPLLPHGSGLKPKSKARFNSLNGTRFPKLHTQKRAQTTPAIVQME